ncbi:UDP-N-acetylmuramate--L-alanine ligase [filamentous cyanobacterium LEGE 11480]|uniref:UDP-N-acetylmuramate--L-alanine ligase n=1 Tax=Romeriopsis navalis LEGE 11480 TaxID=2777977 RepID=A0A928VR58_9CYAN|nr:UDP-N-acetylmuramate--L-alanine ligase [Romeriopsis navalis]MBE9031075.1 UDP-N-acetylmuramate--L-alanine ligase [Romeriopsis navalis LEGE 11480]
MLDSPDFSGKPFHFIGVGGIGMSAIAHVLAAQGLPVSGSDIRLTHITERLQSLGVEVFLKQEAANIEYFLSRQRIPVGVAVETTETQLPQVVCSTAINPSNPEYKRALELGCPIFHRSDILAGLIQQHQSISVAGTHGKTTTSSLIAHMLVECGVDPTVVVGGEVPSLGGNARSGKSEYLVAEADESDGSLVKFQSYIGVLTNIELDHPDHYSDLDQVVDTFKQFSERCQHIIGSIDCPVVRERFAPAIGYSLDAASGADYCASQIEYSGHHTTAEIWERGTRLGSLTLKLLGKHNLSNALAAIAVGRFLELDFATIAAALATAEGAKRRFELRGEVNNIRFIDDYAHHPSEIQTTLAAAKLQAQADGRRLVAVFQPHRFTRTLTFLPEFAQSFVDAEVVAISDIYSAGEVNPGNVTGQHLVNEIAKYQPTVYYQPTLAAMEEFLNQTLEPGDMAIFLGAGNLNQVIPKLIDAQSTLKK